MGAGGHVPTTNVPQTPIRQVIDGAADGDEHARLFRQQCVGCGSDYGRHRRWCPATHVQDALWRLGRRRIGSD